MDTGETAKSIVFLIGFLFLTSLFVPQFFSAYLPELEDWSKYLEVSVSGSADGAVPVVLHVTDQVDWSLVNPDCSDFRVTSGSGSSEKLLPMHVLDCQHGDYADILVLVDSLPADLRLYFGNPDAESYDALSYICPAGYSGGRCYLVRERFLDISGYTIHTTCDTAPRVDDGYLVLNDCKYSGSVVFLPYYLESSYWEAEYKFRADSDEGVVFLFEHDLYDTPGAADQVGFAGDGYGVEYDRRKSDKEYPVLSYSSMLYSETAPSNWYQYSFDDSSWEPVVGAGPIGYYRIHYHVPEYISRVKINFSGFYRCYWNGSRVYNNNWRDAYPGSDNVLACWQRYDRDVSFSVTGEWDWDPPARHVALLDSSYRNHVAYRKTNISGDIIMHVRRSGDRVTAWSGTNVFFDVSVPFRSGYFGFSSGTRGGSSIKHYVYYLDVWRYAPSYSVSFGEVRDAPKAPRIDAVYSDPWYSDQNFSLSVSVSDPNSDLVSCTFTFNGDENTFSVDPEGATFTLEYNVSGDGEYGWSLECVDSEDATSSISGTFFLDTQPPELESSVDHLGDGNFSYTVSVSDLTPTTCYLVIDGSEEEISCSGSGTFQLSGGDHTVEIKAVDSVGHYSSRTYSVEVSTGGGSGGGGTGGGSAGTSGGTTTTYSATVTTVSTETGSVSQTGPQPLSVSPGVVFGSILLALIVLVVVLLKVA